MVVTRDVGYDERAKVPKPTGEPAPKRSKSESPKLRPPGLLELEELLGDYLETRVHVSMGPKLGHVVIDFATLEDLERIYRVMTEAKRPTP